MQMNPMEKKRANEPYKRRLPIVRSEDVEFSAEAADQDDLEAQKRADAADRRQL